MAKVFGHILYGQGHTNIKNNAQHVHHSPAQHLDVVDALDALVEERAPGVCACVCCLERGVVVRSCRLPPEHAQREAEVEDLKHPSHEARTHTFVTTRVWCRLS